MKRGVEEGGRKGKKGGQDRRKEKVTEERWKTDKKRLKGYLRRNRGKWGVKYR